MKELGVGIAGFGSIGKVHVYGYLNLPLFYDPVPCRTRIVGIATAHSETGEKARRTLSVELTTTDWRELIARPDIDIIHVCTPNDSHKDILLAALEAGKHIYCEKPLTRDYAEALEVLKALKSFKGTHQMTFNYRFSPAVLRAHELVQEGFLGRIVNFRMAYLHSGYTDPNRPFSWRLSKEKSGGGASHDLGSHAIDLIRHLVGEVDSVFCARETFVKERRDPETGRERRVDVDDLSVLLLRTEEGALGTLEASRVATGMVDELRFEIHGTCGAIRFNLMDPNWLEVYDLRSPGEPMGGTRGFTRVETVSRYPSPAVFPGPKCSLGWLRIHVACLHHFLAAVAKGEGARPDLTDGAEVQKILEGAARSDASGRWVSLREIPD